MKIALCQLDSVWEIKQKNFERVEKLITNAKKQNADVFVLPEMFATGFTMRNNEAGEPRSNSITLNFLSRIASENRMWVIGTLIEKTKRGNKNAAHIFNRNGRSVGGYYKMHLFPLTQEEQMFLPGSKTPLVDIDGISCSVAICFDLRFPEMFRAISRRGATMIFVLANWPENRREHWLVLLKARAIENQCYVVGVNRTGSGDGIKYSGDSRVFDPFGREIAAAGREEGLLFAEIKKELVGEIRSKYKFLPRKWKIVKECH